MTVNGHVKKSSLTVIELYGRVRERKDNAKSICIVIIHVERSAMRCFAKDRVKFIFFFVSQPTYSTLALFLSTTRRIVRCAQDCERNRCGIRFGGDYILPMHISWFARTIADVQRAAYVLQLWSITQRAGIILLCIFKTCVGHASFRFRSAAYNTVGFKTKIAEKFASVNTVVCGAEVEFAY